MNNHSHPHHSSGVTFRTPCAQGASNVRPGPSRRRSRGFLLLAVVGLLAVLLTLCVGFLVFTRQEVVAVAHIRDKADGSDLAQSALDWAIANIGARLFDATGQVVLTGTNVISCTRANDGCWWYKPYGAGVNRYWPPPPAWPPNPVNPLDEAAWTYMPEDYFPEGGVRGRFYVQLLDANALLNMNDWMQDCMPSQCQAAHMFMNGYGDKDMDFRIEKKNWLSAATYYKPWPYRYCWRAVTNTVDGATSNQSWFWVWGALGPNARFNRSCRAEVGLPSSANETSCGQGPGWAAASFTTQNYVDPDTGRSPVNVNTCFASGEKVPMMYGGDGRHWTMEGVFNIESLRRIIRIGKFFSATDGGKEKDASTDWATLTDAERLQVQVLKTKLAYQYQETMCRYFTGTYNNTLRPTAYPVYSSIPNRNYLDTFGPGAAGVSFYAKVGGSASTLTTPAAAAPTRFPFSLLQFRQNVEADLLAMSANNRNTLYAGAGGDVIQVVNVDLQGDFEVAPGKLDQWTASAIYDNIVPGKAIINGLDPLTELYAMRWGRRETEPVGDFRDVFAHERPDLDTGQDIVENFGILGPGPYVLEGQVPERQLVFGPDWFSTELTTSSTTFLYVVSVQLVDAASVVADANNPRVLYKRQIGGLVELAPDLNVEAGPGLGYYRDGLPRARIMDPAIMDMNCATLPAIGGTTVAHDWMDHRKAKQRDGTPVIFYGTDEQTRRHVFIRSVWDMGHKF